MVTKRRSIICTIFFSAILCCIITLCLGNTFEQVFAKEVISEDTSFSSRIENYEGYGCEDGGTLQHNLNGQTVNYSVEHPTGFGCGSACGPGREGGFSSNYINGCRQWQQMPIISPLYKYWIDEETLSPLTEAERQQFIENVDAAAILWNSTQMNDGTGKIITLQKLSSNGADVVPIRYDATLNSLGEFNPVPLFHEIKLKVFTGRTPLHEFGHMLGLQDLDMNNAPADWAHTVLMGYLAGTPLSYQDIQGLAVANSKHTDHLFNRYFVDGGQYEHVCFYCDLIDTQSSAKTTVLL